MKLKRRRRKGKQQEIVNWFLNTNTSVLYQDRVDGKLVPRMVIPHVMKDDIRLRYPTMITNIYNSCDSALTTNYVNKYYRPDFIAVQQLYGK